MALVEPGYLVLAAAPTGATLPGMRELLTRLRDQYGVDLVVISDDPAMRAIGRGRPRRSRRASPSGSRPIVSMLPAQLFALPRHARAAAWTPSSPRWISKVTLTH